MLSRSAVPQAAIQAPEGQDQQLQFTGPSGKSLTLHVAQLPGVPTRGARVLTCEYASRSLMSVRMRAAALSMRSRCWRDSSVRDGPDEIASRSPNDRILRNGSCRSCEAMAANSLSASLDRCSSIRCDDRRVSVNRRSVTSSKANRMLGGPSSPCDTKGCAEGKRAWIVEHVPYVTYDALDNMEHIAGKCGSKTHILTEQEWLILQEYRTLRDRYHFATCDAMDNIVTPTLPLTKPVYRPSLTACAVFAVATACAALAVKWAAMGCPKW